MRLDILTKGQSLLQKVLFFLIRKDMGYIPGPIAMMSYKKKFFGKKYAQLIHLGLREAKHWELAELEIMGTFLSHRNACHICLSDHSAVVSQVLDPTTMQAILDNHHTAPISNKLKCSLDLLEKIALRPDDLVSEDFLPLKVEGLSHAAIKEVLWVALIFCSMNRISDALGFELAPEAEKVGKFLFKRGYKLASLPQ